MLRIHGRSNGMSIDLNGINRVNRLLDKIIPIINDLISLLDQKLSHYFSSIDLKFFD